jgi:TolB-like protein/DNA-binding winged helix-turn-helix (wHTH) protein
LPTMADVEPGTSSERIDLANVGEFELGRLTIRPSELLVLANGDRRELQPRVMQVLVALAQARPAVVSRDKLIEQCWHGRVVGDDALNRCILSLRHVSKEFTPQPFAIETVPRIGHRLLENGVTQDPATRASKSRRSQLVVLAMLLALIAAAGLFIWQQRRASGAGADPASIAVLPFRNLGSGESYFAEGIGEEIVARLAREPQFRVAGGRSSGQLESDADIREVARRLNVTYLLEGSVRREGDRVRVNADLVRASDGIRLWSDTYDGKLDDIFLIQQRIGEAIAEALRRKLVRRPSLSGPLVTNGEAYNLYLTARGLIKTRNKDVYVTSSNLLRDAIKLDPNYAPAWASLAESISLEDYPDGAEGLIAALPNADRYARHALQLAPNLADGQRVVALLLPYGSPDALSHYRRAVELDPNSAENLIGFGSALGAAGEFDAEMAAYRRARELDSIWYRTTGQLAIRLAETGQRTQAEAIANLGFANNQSNLHIILGRIAAIFGDFSEAGRHWSITARANSPRWSPRARAGVADVRMHVGIDPTPAGYKPGYIRVHQIAEVQTSRGPTTSMWLKRNRNAAAADVYRDDNHMAAKLMLKAGRPQELAAVYDGPVGLLSLRPNTPVRADQLHEAAVVALALKLAGRPADADRLLKQADSRITALYRQRTIPFALDADVAAIRAVQGRRDQALSMLERAVRRGWSDSGNTDLPDIADEPAFRALNGDPRFERIRADLAAHLKRERAEVEKLRI